MANRRGAIFQLVSKDTIATSPCDAREVPARVLQVVFVLVIGLALNPLRVLAEYSLGEYSLAGHVASASISERVFLLYMQKFLR